MLSLSEILLVAFGVAPLLVVVFVRLQQGPFTRVLRLLCLLLSLLALLGWLLWRAGGGYVVLGLFLFFLVLPAYGYRRLMVLSGAGDLSGVRRWLGLLSLLQPWLKWRSLGQTYVASALIRKGAWQESAALMESLLSLPGPHGMWMRSQLYALEGRWRELLELMNQTVPQEGWREYVGVMRTRALAESGQVELGLRELALLGERAEGAGRANLRFNLWAICALLGRPALVEQLLGREQPPLDEFTRRYWLGVAHWRAGQSQQARAHFEIVLRGADPLVQRRVAERMAEAPAAPLSDEAEALLARMLERWALSYSLRS